MIELIPRGGTLQIRRTLRRDVRGRPIGDDDERVDLRVELTDGDHVAVGRRMIVGPAVDDDQVAREAAAMFRRAAESHAAARKGTE